MTSPTHIYVYEIGGMHMENEKSAAGETGRINWHPAFVEAIQMELAAYKDNLEFHSEYQLTSEPLRIDCVVIKKPPDLVIEKNIAAIFREFNLLEYKSPDDYVSVEDFYKVYGYACLYASLEKVPITAMTLSFIESRHPDKLLAHFKEVRKFVVEKTAPGIYTVKGDILPIQVIESHKLSDDDNRFLSHLGKRLDSSATGHIGEILDMRSKGLRVTAYLDVIMRANKKFFKEVYKMKKYPTTEEVLREIGLIDKWEAEAEQKKSMEIAMKLKELDVSDEKILAATGLSVDKIQTSLN
jgi:hypothetical protein